VYTLPTIDDLDSLGSAKIFSTLDLTSSYWKIQLDDSSKPKSAFITRRGLFEFSRTSFGLSNAPATMQRLMDSVLSGLKWQVCLVYLDDIIIFSFSVEPHLLDGDLFYFVLEKHNLSLTSKNATLQTKSLHT
jgi:hypothetical protein